MFHSKAAIETQILGLVFIIDKIEEKESSLKRRKRISKILKEQKAYMHI
ncbi:MAG: hypothetical protein IJN25_05910 [Clostridia bacterium]|nr:hypothetical protein [Clostridia bacterium]